MGDVTERLRCYFAQERGAFCTTLCVSLCLPVLPLDTGLSPETLPQERRALEGIEEREMELTRVREHRKKR